MQVNYTISYFKIRKKDFYSQIFADVLLLSLFIVLKDTN